MSPNTIPMASLPIEDWNPNVCSDQGLKQLRNQLEKYKYEPIQAVMMRWHNHVSHKCERIPALNPN
jgi:hypothetical protein